MIQDGSTADREPSPKGSWLARGGSELTDLQTPDLLRETGMQLKAWDYFLTLLAHERVIQGGTQYLTRQNKQGRIASSGRAGEADFLSRQGWLRFSQE